ncbi:DUF5804 family protein [Natrononativus amylolyticus]|uniref:DUF5804 family protein n=1 Tax=Natrononativus amylolyticus TaxID=2963434 RepID=UPI0020CF5A87|nr:DUF5804 family protein [Natrononativus amylolyticus]
MTRVCLVGAPEVNLQYELLSRETSREALATYDLERPFENSLSLRTVSVGAAVSLLNDLQWYLVRFVDDVLVQEPSVSETEWLSRGLAEALRNGELEPGETGEFCKVYGLEADEPESSADDADDHPVTTVTAPRLVEPLYVRRTGGEVPDYDLRDVEETLVVRLTEAEFSP